MLSTLVGSLVEFAHSCSASLVAEGVETAADADRLLALGVDGGQGWHFGRPAPVEVLLAASAGTAAPVPRPRSG